MSLRRKYTTCRVCSCSGENNLYYPKEKFYGSEEEFEYFECSSCGCLQIIEIPSNLASYYNKNYHSFSPLKVPSNLIHKWIRYHKDNYSILRNNVIGHIFSVLFTNEDLNLFSRIKLTKKSKIVDIGCGNGKLIHRLKSAGFDNILGVDPFIEHDIVHENGTIVQKRSLNQIQGEWDLVMMHHALEHIPEQAEAFQDLYRLVSADGVCLVRIPIVPSYAWKKYGMSWVGLDAPRHLYLHTLKSVCLLANKAGLQLTEAVYDSLDFQFWGSELYQKNIPMFDETSHNSKNAKDYFSKEQIKEYQALAKKLNQQKEGDQVALFFKKFY